ncbi:conserved hypothetical protein [Rubrobacter xylanophilus DSM 9941]|uniref:Flippase-like domain-containing protein n=1 Tax=Rubrobacter xylanophilus (strain DSM 9941 / JCM 11954 / NBRC 16129 / PRD-1) TaxID=266117 RepID=Q1AZ18_RUBXD|nr:lysylphosphatidylglycerol synthase domain-containing protein [Rubrobacter xylanophilus]ABG03360.1 conserved hypothetical protein [Rubrobacter xylanophilus DSM 9941]
MRRSLLGVLLGLALGAVGFAFAAYHVDRPLRIAHLWPVPLAAAVTLLCWLIQGSIIALLAWPELRRVRVLQMTRVYLATQAVGGITPFAGGEIAYQLLALKRHGLGADVGGAVIALRSALNGVVLLAAAVAGLLVVRRVPFVGGGSSLPFSATTVLLVGVVALSAAWLLLVFLIRRRRGREGGGGGPGLVGRAASYLRHLRDSLLLIWRREPRVIAGCLLLAALYWLLYPLLGTLSLRAAGWDGSGWLAVFAAQYVLFLVIPIAPTPGNGGAAEIAFVALMSNYVPQGALLGGVVLWRVLNHFSELVVGAFIAGSEVHEDIELARREFGSG